MSDFTGINALGSRAAGYAVAEKCLEVQAAAEEQDPSLKTEQRTILHDDARSWFIGALGEMEVGRLLAQLGPEWFVRHAVPIGAGTKDVDHLVIGPPGVFVFNTKHHNGANVWVGDHTIRINNVDKRYLRSGRADGLDVARRLGAKAGFAVAPLSALVMLHPRSIVDRRAPNNRPVSVIDARNLVPWLTSLPPILSQTEQSLLTLAAEEPSTWHIDPRAADTLRVMQRFERLVVQVGATQRPVAPPMKPVTQPVRAPRASATARATRPGRVTSGKKRPSVGSLLQLWLPVVVGMIALLVFRQVANQPCATPTGCLAPPLYLALKPFAMFLVGVGSWVGIVGTLVWTVRRIVRR